MKNIAKLIIIIFVFLITGCHFKYSTSESINIKTNFARSKEFKIIIENNTSYSKFIKFLVKKDGKPINKIKFSNNITKLTISAELINRVPFNLINSIPIQGKIKFISNDGTIYTLPFSVKIKSWVETNKWIFEILLGLLILLFLLNLSMLFFKYPVEGNLTYIEPCFSVIPLYPPSLYWYFNRNILYINSKEYLPGCKDLPEHIIRLEYHRTFVIFTINRNYEINYFENNKHINKIDINKLQIDKNMKYYFDVYIDNNILKIELEV